MGLDSPADDVEETSPRRDHSYSSSIDDDDTIIPKGALDPVYEAKARVLNRAVR